MKEADLQTLFALLDQFCKEIEDQDIETARAADCLDRAFSLQEHGYQNREKIKFVMRWVKAKLLAAGVL